MPKQPKRVKSKVELLPCAGWQDADVLIDKLRRHQTHIATATAAAQEDIAEKQQALADLCQPHHDDIKRIVKSIEAFCTHSRDDFEGKKSRQVNHGVVGWRYSESISVSDETVDLIRAVYKKKAADYLHVKESPNKEALDALTDADLAAVKARRNCKDTFFVEPTAVEAIDTGDPA